VIALEELYEAVAEDEVFRDDPRFGHGALLGFAVV